LALMSRSGVTSAATTGNAALSANIDTPANARLAVLRFLMEFLPRLILLPSLSKQSNHRHRHLLRAPRPATLPRCQAA
jgi:hypothetical protein